MKIKLPDANSDINMPIQNPNMLIGNMADSGKFITSL
jgi:hypothetical protein